MQKHGIQTPECFVASTPEEAEEIYTTKMNKGENYYYFLGHMNYIRLQDLFRSYFTTPISTSTSFG